MEQTALVRQAATTPVALGNLQRVRRAKVGQYHNIEWMQCFLLFFHAQTATAQREIRGLITTMPPTAIVLQLGVSAEQIAAALTLADRLPSNVAKHVTSMVSGGGGICF